MSTAITAKNSAAVSMPVIADDLNSYLSKISNATLLSAEEEQTLARQLRDHEDLEAARQLVMSQLRFVVHIARSYKGYGLPMADLVQEGNIGLMKAVKRFNPDMNVRLISFAVHWIRAEIHEFVIRNWRIVKVATTKAQRKLFFKLRSAPKKTQLVQPGRGSFCCRGLGSRPQSGDGDGISNARARQVALMRQSAAARTVLCHLPMCCIVKRLIHRRC